MAEGGGDTMHYLYATLSSPSILLLKTHKQARVEVDWNRFSSSNASEQEDSVRVVGGDVLASSILDLQNLFIYDDPSDQANMQAPSTNLTTIPLHTLNWILNVSKNRVEFKSEKEVKNGTKQIISIQMEASANKASTTDLPHLLTTNNLTVIDVTLDNVDYGGNNGGSSGNGGGGSSGNGGGSGSSGNDEINSGSSNNGNIQFPTTYNHPRLGVGMVMMVDRGRYGSSDLISQDSLDDTLAPGSFRTVNWLSEKLINTTNKITNSDNNEVFVQWRPICYTDHKKSLQSYTIVKNYALQHVNHSSKLFPLSLATGYYGINYLDNGVETSFLNVSFGVGKDKWYSKSNYTTWKLTYGIGEHPIKNFSLFIILLISFGLGIPALLLVSLAVYMPIKRCCRNRRHGYEEISSSYPEII